MNRRTLSTAIAVVVILAASALAGCNPGSPVDPSPTPTVTKSVPPSPTPTPSTTPDEKQQNIDAAKAAYSAYSAETNAVWQEGMAGWETRILPLVGTPELTATLTNFYTQAAAQGLHQTGTTRIATLAVTDYVADPTGGGHERVSLDVCLDTSESQLLNAAGEPVTQPGFPTRLITAATMQRQGVGGPWTVNSEVTDEGRPC